MSYLHQFEVNRTSFSYLHKIQLNEETPCLAVQKKKRKKRRECFIFPICQSCGGCAGGIKYWALTPDLPLFYI